MQQILKGQHLTDLNHKVSRAKLDSFELEYIDIGEGPVVLFLHGALTNMQNWFRLLPFLQEHYRCIVPTLPLGAHRIPAKPFADLSVAGVAGTLNEFIRFLNCGAVNVVANDTGGVYAQMLAARYETNISRLVLSSCDALDVFPPNAFSSLPKAVKVPGYLQLMKVMFKHKSFVKSELVLGLLTNSMSPEELQHPLENFIQSAAIRNDFQLAASNWHSSITTLLVNELKSFDKPVVIIWGEDDKLFPVSLGKSLAGVFPNAEFYTVPKARTYIQQDQPVLFAQHIRAFLAT